MIIDSLNNLEQYVSINPLIKAVTDFLLKQDIRTLPVGKQAIQGTDVTLNITETQPKTRGEAKLETHQKYIDIQIPITATEEMGYSSITELQPTNPLYNADKDISFYEGSASSYLKINPGMFAMFLPQDGHAPGISETGLRKAIFKVKVNH